MSIISDSLLTSELPIDADSDIISQVVNEGSNLTDTWATHYDPFPNYDDTPSAPYEVKRICTNIAKSLYYIYTGVINRDGNEDETWNNYLENQKGYLESIEIEPYINSVAISLNSDGVQLIKRNMNILRFHPKCRIVSGSSNIWNQLYHWDIRKGNDCDDEYLDGWYLDAESYKDEIEGILYYAISFRNDHLDYQKYWKKSL